MAEPTLPAGAAIAAFVMAVISWYGMLRTGVQYIYNDIKDSKSYKRDVNDMIEDLGRQNRQLEQWKKQWLVWEETPVSLHLEFWGETEYKTIKVKLQGMQGYCTEGAKELEDFATITESKWKTIPRVKRAYLKTKFITVKKKYLQELLEKMAKALKALGEAAKDGWQREWQHKTNDVDFAHVYRTGIGHLLVPIAMHTHCYTETLWQSCHFARETLTTELDLDVFGASLVDSREKHSETIVKAAAEKQATLTILTRGATLREAEMTRVCIRQSEKSNDYNFTALVGALSSVLNGSEECHFIAGPDLAFSVSRSKRQHYGPGSGVRVTFREIQSRNQPPTFANGALLGSISKFRIASELAQACLLFHRTSWFSNICSCGIRCGKPSDVCKELQYDFTLQLGYTKHQPAQWGDARVPLCWGQEQHNWNTLTKPVRRLGILLIEVTLGTTVLETTCDDEGTITSVTFIEGERDNLRRTIYTIDRVIENARLAAHKSQLYTGAIRHCVTAQFPQTPDDAQMTVILATFYWDVVDP